MTQRMIKTASDIAALTADEFVRFVPDLILWHRCMREVVAVAGDAASEGCGILWTDDGVNELTHIQLTDAGTGEAHTYSLGPINMATWNAP